MKTAKKEMRTRKGCLPDRPYVIADPHPEVRRRENRSGTTERAGHTLQVDVRPGVQVDAAPRDKNPDRQAGHGWHGRLLRPLLGGPEGLALAKPGWAPPGRHLEHPAAQEGCRSASQGLTLTLITCPERYAGRRRRAMSGGHGHDARTQQHRYAICSVQPPRLRANRQSVRRRRVNPIDS